MNAFVFMTSILMAVDAPPGPRMGPAGGPRASAAGSLLSEEGDPLGEVLSEAEGLVLRAPRPGSIEALGRLLPRPPPGGGDVEPPLRAIQTHYDDPLNGNVVLLIWEEGSANPGGVDISVDSVVVGNFSIPGGPAFITSLEPGRRVFRVEEAGAAVPSFQEVAIVVLASQPFGDVQELLCAGAVKEGLDTCKVSLRWMSPATPPGFYLILVDDDVVLQTADAAASEASVGGIAPGSRKVTVIGFEEAEPGSSQALYRGRFVETVCTISCEDVECPPPSDLDVCQTAFGPGSGENGARLGWTNGLSSYSGGIEIHLDGKLVLQLQNDPADGRSATRATVEGISPGEHTFAVRGTCEGTPTAPVQSSATLLSASPPRSPVEGAIICDFDAALGMTRVAWTPDQPSSFIDVYRFTSDFRLSFLGTISGDSTSFQTTAAAERQVIVLQFFADVEGRCLGSIPRGCDYEEERRFIRGVCEGRGTAPSLTGAILLLNYLFLGGDAPSCLESCDTDGNSMLEITDPIKTIEYLFLDGEPPAGWLGKGSPACEKAPPERCGSFQDACP